MLHRGLNSLKSACKKLAHKTGEFLGNKITDTVAKFNEEKIEKKLLKMMKIQEILKQ